MNHIRAKLFKTILNEWTRYVLLQYLKFIVTLILLVATTHCI